MRIERILAFLSLLFFTGLAFAQGANNLNFAALFAPSQITGGSDLSLQALSFIFGSVGTLALPASNGSPILGSMFSIFNSVVLAMGGSVVIYILFVGTLHTAHEGQVLGQKWGSLWVPVRSFLGVSLLLPTTSGYSIVQIGIMWVVMQGVGAADYLWNAITNVQSNTGSAATYTPSQPSLASVESSMENIIQIVGCMQAINQAAFPGTIIQLNDQYGSPGSMGSYTPGPNGQANEIDVGGSGSTVSGSYCGSITWTPIKGQEPAFHQAVLNLIYSAVQSTNILIQNQKAGGVVNSAGSYVNGALGLSSMIAVVAPSQQYMSSLQFGSVPQAQSPCQTQGSGSSACTQSQTGWVLAGAYWLNLANASGSAGNVANVTAPTAVPNSVNYDAAGFGQSTAKAYGNYINSFANGTAGNLVNNGGGTQGLNLNCSATSMMGPLAGVGFALAGLGGAMAALVFSEIFCASVNSIFSSFTSISNTSNPNSFMSLSQNPIQQLQNLGQNILTAVEMIWLVGSMLVLALGIVMSILSCITGVGYGLISFFVWLIPLLMSLLLALFVSGAMMAYYIPLLPFIYFSFGVLGWLMSVIEAMVAGPLVALGILHPDGHEVMGEAKPAVLLLANVFLRPSLLLFGLVTAISLSYAGSDLVNIGYNIVLNSINAGGILQITSSIAIILIYCSLQTVMLTHIFKLILHVPNRAMRWIGGGHEGYGEEQAVGELKAGVEAGMQGLGQVGAQVAGGAGKAGTDIGKGLMEKKAGQGSATGEKAPAPESPAFREAANELGAMDNPFDAPGFDSGSTPGGKPPGGKPPTGGAPPV